MSLGFIIVRLIDFYELLILAYCIMSWLPRSNSEWIEDIRGVLAGLVEPFLGLFRSLPLNMGGIDFSPIVAVLVLQLVERLLLRFF